MAALALVSVAELLLCRLATRVLSLRVRVLHKDETLHEAIERHSRG